MNRKLAAPLATITLVVTACGYTATPAKPPVVKPALAPTSTPTPKPPAPAPTPTPTLTSTPPAPVTPPATSQWNLVWSTDFPTNAALGSFNSDGVNSALAAQWRSYPSGWPDTATERGLPVGGYYDPPTTVWISGGEMHIKMWRGASGSVHSCAMVPVQAQDRTYGKYIETFRVSHVMTGYKSAHLLWPHNGKTSTIGFEVDYPEEQFDKPIHAFVHNTSDTQLSFPTDLNWSSWHTTEIDWTPTSLSFYMDGKLIGTTTSAAYVPNVPMDWIIQNESALNGETASLNSSAQMDISYVAYYSYVG